MQEQAITRAQILLEQGRYADAEQILLDLLPAYPDNPLVLHYLAEVKLQTGQLDAATEYADAALAVRPDLGFLFHLKARIAIQKDQYDAAEDHLQQAIQLDPEEAGFYATLASVKLVRKQFREALELSDQALELDAENILALNNRSRALLKLDKKEESFQTIEGALREDPNNAYTHANYGWNLLEKGHHKKALEHFREALKNDPDLDMAKSGMVESLKASNPVYRLFLKYSFWISNLTQKYQWGVIIGFYLLIRVLNALARSNKSLMPYITPLIILLALVAFSTWIITPLSNLMFRLNKYGKYLLDKKEIMSSNFVGISLLIFITSLLGYFLLQDERWLGIAVFGFTMMLPLGIMFSPTKYKNILVYYAGAMALIGALAIFTSFQTGELFNGYATVYLMAFIAFQWVGNFLLIREANR